MKKKGILAILGIVVLMPLVTTSVSSCKHTADTDTILNVNHSWKDVEELKSQSINGTERLARIEYRSSTQLQRTYANEDDYAEEKREIQQSNLELKLDEIKKEDVLTSDETYKVIEDQTRDEGINTVDWNLIFKQTSSFKQQMVDEINTLDLTQTQKADLFDQVDKEFNEIITSAKQQKLDQEGTEKFIRDKINNEIKEKITAKKEEMIASNVIQSYIYSEDFEINEQLGVSSTNDISLYDWEKASPEEKTNIEQKLIPLLITYEKLPFSSSKIPNYNFGLKIKDFSWVDRFSAKFTLELFLTKIDSSDKLVSVDITDAQVKDNICGRKKKSKGLANNFVLEQEDENEIMTYENFVSRLEKDSYEVDGGTFIPNAFLKDLCVISIKSEMPADLKEELDYLMSSSQISVGAFVSHTSNFASGSGSVDLKLVIYDDTTFNNDDINFVLDEKDGPALTIQLSEPETEEIKDVTMDEMSLFSSVKGLNQTIDAYKYYSDDNNYQYVKDINKKTKKILDFYITYVTLQSVSQFVSMVTDVIGGINVFSLGSVISIGFEVAEMVVTYKTYKKYKNAAQSNLNTYEEVRNSPEYAQVKEAIEKNNLFQTRREAEKEIAEFTDESDSQDILNVMSPEKLLEEFAKKYGSKPKTMIEKKAKNIKSLVANGFLYTAPNFFNLFKGIAYSSLIKLPEKTFKLKLFNSSINQVFPGLASKQLLSAPSVQKVRWAAEMDLYSNEMKMFSANKMFTAMQNDLEHLKGLSKTDKRFGTLAISFEQVTVNSIAQDMSTAGKSLQSDVSIFQKSMQSIANCDENILNAINASKMAAGEGSILENPKFVSFWKETCLTQGIDSQCNSFLNNALGFQLPENMRAQDCFPSLTEYYTSSINTGFANLDKFSDAQKKLVNSELTTIGSFGQIDNFCNRGVAKGLTPGDFHIKGTVADPCSSFSSIHHEVDDSVINMCSSDENFYRMGYQESIDRFSDNRYVYYTSAAENRSWKERCFYKRTNVETTQSKFVNNEMADKVEDILLTNTNNSAKESALNELNKNLDGDYYVKAADNTSDQIYSYEKNLKEAKSTMSLTLGILTGVSVVLGAVAQVFAMLVNEFFQEINIIEN